MTTLKCNVTNCANNADQCCCRPEIKVTGACACGCEQTNCGDFMERGKAAANSGCACHSPNSALDVACEAKNCTYNQNMKCVADRILVDSSVPCDCTDCQSQTECATFRMK